MGSGANAIWVHQTQPDGTLTLVKEVKSAREEDGPRHAVVSANGKCLYAVRSAGDEALTKDALILFAK